MYRRPMSPYNSRAITYLQALERDQTINNLRRQYAHYRSVQSEYDDLKYEISKAERENKNLEQKNHEIQDDYLNKIQGNKAVISDIGAQIQQMEQKIKKINTNSTQKQAQNQKTIENLKQAKTKIYELEEQNKKLEDQLQAQQSTVVMLHESLDELVVKKKDAQLKNKTESQIIDKEFSIYKAVQEKAKSEQSLNQQLKEELSLLKNKKAKLQSKVEQVQQKMKDLKKKYEHCQFQADKLSIRCHEAQKETSKVYAQALTLKQNIDNSLTSNKQHTTKLKSLQVVLKQNINGLHVKHATREKLATQCTDLMKDIEKSQTLIKLLDKDTAQQQLHNKGLITNLKKSIQSDEEAVKALTRKAAILNLISQS